MIVSQILKEKGADVITISQDKSIKDVSDLLAEKRVGAVVVTDSNHAVDGIISERDIIRGIAQYGAGVMDKQVSELMTKDVITHGPDDSVDELMQEMTKSRIRHLPILEDGNLIGVISIGDVVKNRVEELESEGNMLREYISTG